MKDPERWLADGSGAPPGVVEMLRAAQRPSPPPVGMRLRLGAELESLAGMVRPSGPGWWFAGGAAVVAVGVGAWFGLSSFRDAPPRLPEPPPAALAPAPAVVSPTSQVAVAAPAPAAPTPVSPAPPATPSSAPRAHAAAALLAEARVRAAPRAHAPASPAASAPRGASRAAAAVSAPAPVGGGGDSLAREAALVEQARRAVRARPAAALATLDRHRRDFPAGQLTAEREFLTVHALVQLGRRTEAEIRGRRLVERYPGSAYAQQIPALLARASGGR